MLPKKVVKSTRNSRTLNCPSKPAQISNSVKKIQSAKGLYNKDFGNTSLKKRSSFVSWQMWAHFHGHTHMLEISAENWKKPLITRRAPQKFRPSKKETPNILHCFNRKYYLKPSRNKKGQLRKRHHFWCS